MSNDEFNGCVNITIITLLAICVWGYTGNLYASGITFFGAIYLQILRRARG